MQEYLKWVASPSLDEKDRQELTGLTGNEKEIESRFYTNLQFGTAGLRGIMAVGLNRMNRYIVKQTTQGIANLVIKAGGQDRGVAIAYDCRNNSEEFAKDAACVLAANGIKVLLFDGMRPTPELSFIIREKKCIAGINITASHNPKEYNGYKAYWEDGAQMPPEHADTVEDEIRNIDIFTGAKTLDFEDAKNSGLIEIVGEEIDELFLKRAEGEMIDREVIASVADKLGVVYTPFHGAGYKLVPEILRRAGVKNLIPVEEQMIPDGNFTTVANPNPESIVGYEYAIKTAKQNKADFVICTDPDADRIGIMYREKNGEYTLLGGNKTGAVYLDYIASARQRTGRMPARPYAVRTVVSSDLIDKIAAGYGVETEVTFTGFKFIAERMGEMEPQGKNCIFAFEESFGYMIGNYCRDKDAVTSAMLMTEMAAYHYKNGRTLGDALNDLYEKHGAHADRTVNVALPGIEGEEKIKQLMNMFRSGAVEFPDALKVVRTTDHSSGEITEHGVTVGKSSLSGSDLIVFEFADKSKIMVRPSGTEPKIKFYLFAEDADMIAAEKKIDFMTDYVENVAK